MSTQYDCPHSCNRCGGENIVKSDPFPPYGSGETETKCCKCGFEDYWSFGFFMSSAYGLSECQKYSFDHN
ncbi:hypothetical protein [Aeromonas phage T7-Ah]|uniref:Uncharacterized protein n=1 Tax=Aeromonas phage T7-Ah TaxID=2759196 RepID=A0A7S6HSB9_9CAUD|nr:hypothetical protein [Aeromonas phage T7-Ah]